MAINQNLGLAIRLMRIQRGLSQEKFAEIANIHRTYVSSIELGKVSISLEIAEKVAKAFNVKLSDLVKKAENIAMKEGSKE